MSLSRGRPAARQASASAAAESWFLERGLPSVLTRRDRWRRLWPRSAPALAAYGALQACILPVYLITGGHDVEITAQPTTSELVVLAIVALALPLMALAGWLVSRPRRWSSWHASDSPWAVPGNCCRRPSSWPRWRP
ncbi:hypothetical protein MHEI_39820 [Mycobacterium heidelbergense]|nr:hypothetical protein MHEI_39820 [Mycobacterium heidelbergense]